jgi:GntR family transcriptional regulator
MSDSEVHCAEMNIGGFDMPSLLDESSGTTLYKQLEKIIIEKIEGGEWPVDTKLPTEAQLCELYGVSRITVRQTLNNLKSEGYLYRKQGKGTFVCRPKLVQNLGHFYSFSKEIEKLGCKPGSAMLDFSVVEADYELSKDLKIAEKDRVYAVRRLRLADGEPIAVETSWIPHAVAPGLAQDDIKKYGLYCALAQILGRSPNWGEESFEAVLMNSDEALALRARAKDAALRLTRLAYADSIPVEYCVSIIRGDKYIYKIELQ